jgi:hypothetical protein
MSKLPITHLIIDTSSTNDDYNGDCDYCLIPMTVDYILYLLGYMDEVRRMHRADDAVYSLECWDGSFSFFRFNDKLEELRDVDGNLAVDVPRGEPILLTADPQFKEDDFQRVECQTVQIISLRQAHQHSHRVGPCREENAPANPAEPWWRLETPWQPWGEAHPSWYPENP